MCQPKRPMELAYAPSMLVMLLGRWGRGLVAQDSYMCLVVLSLHWWLLQLLLLLTTYPSLSEYSRNTNWTFSVSTNFS